MPIITPPSAGPTSKLFRREPQLERTLRTTARARVRDLEPCDHTRASGSLDVQLRVSKARVRQPEPEREQRGDVPGVVPAVPDEQSLAVDRMRADGVAGLLRAGVLSGALDRGV